MFTTSSFFVNSGEGFGVVLASSEFPFSEIDEFLMALPATAGHSGACVMPGYAAPRPRLSANEASDSVVREGRATQDVVLLAPCSSQNSPCFI